MPPGQYTGLIPMGQIGPISTPGTTVLLSQNIGPQSGQVYNGNYLTPPVPGIAWRYIEIQAGANNPGNLFLLPRGKTASANPGSILCVIPPGGSLPLPTGILVGQGFVPENFCLDTDTAGSNYAYGFAALG